MVEGWHTWCHPITKVHIVGEGPGEIPSALRCLSYLINSFLTDIKQLAKLAKRGTLHPLSDVYVRSFLCPFSYFDKTLLHKSSWVIKPGPWSQSQIFFFVDHESNIVHRKLSNPPAMLETRVQSLGREDPVEDGMATHSRIPAWKIPWTEKPGGLQSTESRRVRQAWATTTFTCHSFLDSFPT